MHGSGGGVTRIRVTFYTGSDDFSTDFALDDARGWIGTRVSGPTITTAPDGTTTTGPTVAAADPEDLARWFATIALADAAREKALNVHERPGKWVSIRPQMVQAVGAEVIDGDDVDGARPGMMTTSELWTRLPLN
jgi:hypothetical protein